MQICAMLAAVDSMEFSRVRESLGVSDSVLCKHLKVLEGAGDAPPGGEGKTPPPD
nr:transcriptional regulator [Streptomyces sp. SID5594]